MNVPGTPNVLQLHSSDNVVVALRDMDVGVSLGDGIIKTRSAIPMGHKIACAMIAAGGAIVKCGQPIGMARAGIAPGEHVHVNNVAGVAGGF